MYINSKSRLSHSIIGALCLAAATPALAQAPEIREARSQIEWTLGNLDQMLEEQNRNEREWREVKAEERRLQSIASKLDWTVSNFNMNCTRSGTVANQCPQWRREINQGNAQLEEGYAEVNRRVEVIDQRQRELQVRVDTMRMRLMDNTRLLATACRNTSLEQRGGLCNIPGGFRNSQSFANEAAGILRASL